MTDLKQTPPETLSSIPVSKLIDRLTDGKGGNPDDFFSGISHRWAKEFEAWYVNHIMADELAALCANTDPLTEGYVAIHENLIRAAIIAGGALIRKDLLWHPEDRRLYQRYCEAYSHPDNELLREINLEWGSNITNLYGMYDVDPAIFAAYKGRDVIDGGSCIGDTLHTLINLMPESRIYCFEPSAENIKQMKSLFSGLAGNDKIVCEHAALDEKAGKVCLSGAGSIGTTAESTKLTGDDLIDAISLDEYVQSHNLQVGLIKLDTEGSEFEIVKGALNTIKEQRPIMSIAIYHRPEEFYRLKPFLEDLKLGYKFRIRRSCFCNPTCELVLVAVPEL